MIWESPNCNFCGGDKKKEYLVNPRKHWYEGKPLRLVECLDCRLVYADPRPKFERILTPFMQMGGWAESITIRKLNRPFVHRVHREIVQYALKYCEAKSLFDVGTGAGTLLMEAKKLGLTVAGNDINSYACHMLEEIGITIYNLPTQQLELEQKFDIITMLDYLEHTYTPFNDLKWAYDHLAPKGILFFKTLYLNCPNHQRQGDDWNLFEAGHFHFFYVGVLFDMLKKLDFKILEHQGSTAIIRVIAQKNLKNLSDISVSNTKSSEGD